MFDFFGIVRHRNPILILTLAAMSADVVHLSAHVGERLYPIPYLSEETLAALDQDDASVEDWVEAVGEPTLPPLDFDLLLQLMTLHRSGRSQQ